MTRGIRNLVESLFTQLKRRLANFAGYFPEGRECAKREGVNLDLGRLLQLSKVSFG